MKIIETKSYRRIIESRSLSYDEDFVKRVLKMHEEGKSVWRIAFETERSQALIKSIITNSDTEHKPTLNSDPEKRKGVSYSKGSDLPEFVKKFINDNKGKSPYWICHRMHMPIGAIVKYFIEEKMPISDNYLRYVPMAYKEMYKKTRKAE